MEARHIVATLVYITVALALPLVARVALWWAFRLFQHITDLLHKSHE